MEKTQLTALAKRAIDGDKGAFEELYAEHARSILFHVRSLIVDKENYTDVAQDVALEMFTHIKQLREPAAFRGWMHQVIRTTCADHNRSLKSSEKHMSTADNEELLEAVEDEDRATDPEGAALAMLEGNRLFALVNELPVNYREVIVQRYYDDLSYKEIAEAQGVSVTNVSTRLQRAMTAIRKKIGEMDAGQVTLEGKTRVLDKGIVMKEEGNKTAFQHTGELDEGTLETIDYEPTKEELERMGLNDDIGLKSSLLSGVATLVPDEAVQTVVAQVNTKLAAVESVGHITGQEVVTATGVGPGLGVVATVISSVVLVGALAVGAVGITTANNANSIEETTTANEEPAYTAHYMGSMHIEFTDANGGSTDLNVVEVNVVEDEAAAEHIDWQLLGLDEQAGSLLAQGSGTYVGGASLEGLVPGNYQVIFTLVDAEGATAQISRSFTITED